MITTTERQEFLIDQYGALINPSKARLMREAGLGLIEDRKLGPYVWDQAGTRYIDCRDDKSVYNVGRKNPELVAALTRALTEYDLGNSLYFSEPRIQLAHKLGQLSPNRELRGVAFGASGGEINDFAIKLARVITQKSKVVSMKNAMHGATGFSLSANGRDEEVEAFGPLMPNFVQVPFNDIEALRAAVDDQTACVILEPVQGAAGVRIPDCGYLKGVREICTRAGALMIVDEVETGLGRTGKMLAVNHAGVVPDIVTLGNSLGGGLFPITAAMFRSDYLRFWDEHPFLHHSTLGGSDLGCVMALATLDYIEKHRLSEKSQVFGRRFAQAFSELRQRYPEVIKGFRQLGLMMAVDLSSQSLGAQMSRDLSQFGVLASCRSDVPCTMRISPSLTIHDQDVEAILEAFDRASAGCHSILVPMDPDVLSALINSFR